MSTGYTLVELLIVLALAGLFTTMYVGSRPGRLGGAVAALRSQVAAARFEAIQRNVPVAVVLRGAQDSFVTLASTGFGSVCEEGVEVAQLDLGEFPGVEAESVPPGGLVWLPSGSGRTCGGSGAFNQTIVLSEGKRTGRVIVSRAGRIRSELGL